ncbi:MAG: ATP-binding cassette domain-containing protein [Lactobacillaceae bacterium]|jgi:energy-coupling factor transport system ATP-binding protein|nr:ATP-binding cassette domain-containing protein [Lactobacillaceae bacterium]
MTKYSLTISKLSFGYLKNRPILKNINLQVQNGEWISFLGSNGSGKTTLFRTILSLEGKKENIELFGNKVAAVFQNPDEQFYGTTVEDDLAFTLENQQVDPKLMDFQIDNILQKLNLLDIKKENPQNLSGGQKQKVALASALISDAKILLLDEITSMLDLEDKQEILALIDKIHQEDKKTILAITHNADEAMMSDKVAVMKNGEIVALDTPQEILQNSQLVEKYKLPLTLKQKFNKIPNDLLGDIV